MLSKRAEERTDKAVMKKCAGCKKKNCDGCSLKPGEKITGIKEEVFLLPEEFEAQEGQGFGIAFDIGTTTVAAVLWDLEKKVQLEAESCVNPQRIAGSDVISRITYSRQSRENRQRLQRLTVEKMDELAQRLCSKRDREERIFIRKAAVVGNTAMCEILLGFSMEGLWAAPFHKDYTGCMRITGKEIGCSFLKDTLITVLPCIGGYVGADALAVYTYVKSVEKRKHVLAVDIGTNGEILLSGEKNDYTCSAAAGPALEGAAVSQGMAASSGAIEEVKLLGSFPRQYIYCKVIGEGSPKGICGSGLIDALKVLRYLKVIDETGYLLNAKEAGKAGVPIQICRRLLTEEGENRILLTDEEHPVYLTAGDIRQLQLAKSAIRTGIEILLKKEGIKAQELNHIYLAGAFGSHIKVESAVAIGLLPDVSGEKITYAGNCAGMGAAMALLSESVIEDMERDAEKIRHIELAEEKAFEENFLSYMALN